MSQMDKMENSKNATFRTWPKKLMHIFKNITVEPILACYVVGCILANLATQNLSLEKACRVNLAYSTDVCDALTRRDAANFTNEETNIQQIVAGMTAWKAIVQSALPCLMILFYGSWSDRHGRRMPCILFPVLGELITVLGLMLCTYFENSRMEIVGLTDALFPGLSGGWFTMLMGVFSYIGDITNEEERTLRVGIANLCFTLGIPIGNALSGVLLKIVGFYGIYSISATLYVVAITYGLGFGFLSESVVSIKPKEIRSEKKSLIADFFDYKHVIDTFKVAFKDGANQRRLRVIMLMLSLMVVIGPLYGEMSVLYLFTRFQFKWSEIEFSFFSTYGTLTGLLGTTFAVGVLSHKFQIDDAFIGIMSSVSKILGGFVYAFAVKEWQLYLAPLVEIFSGTSFTAMRSMATKLVEKDELGKVNSLFGAAEALMPLVYMPMYSYVYKGTIDTFPGAFFLVGGAMIIPTVFVFLWMYKLKKRDPKSRTNDICNFIRKHGPKASIDELESFYPKSQAIVISNGKNLEQIENGRHYGGE